MRPDVLVEDAIAVVHRGETRRLNDDDDDDEGGPSKHASARLWEDSLHRRGATNDDRRPPERTALALSSSSVLLLVLSPSFLRYDTMRRPVISSTHIGLMLDDRDCDIEASCDVPATPTMMPQSSSSPGLVFITSSSRTVDGISPAVCLALSVRPGPTTTSDVAARTFDGSTRAAEAGVPVHNDAAFPFVVSVFFFSVIFIPVVVVVAFFVVFVVDVRRECDASQYDDTSMPNLSIASRKIATYDGSMSRSARTIDPYATLDGDIEYRTTS
jgi:hypothetical protein